MSQIKSIDQLYNTLRLEGVTRVDELEKAFELIADALLNNYGIRRGDKTYRFVEIEFYHNLTDDVGKNITYKRGYAESCDFFFHNYGVDLCFESTPESYGGILIRSVECNGEFINGPVKVTDVLFDKFSSIREPKGFPMLLPLPHSRPGKIVPVRSSRWIKSSDKKYRYSWPQEMWNPDPKKYAATPWSPGSI